MRLLLVVLTLLMGFSSCKQNDNQSEQAVDKKQDEQQQGGLKKAPLDSFDTQAVNKVFQQNLGKKAGFYKITFPRKDLNVTLDSIPLAPGFSHTSWMAFLPLKDGKAKMMGDMVLLDKEIERVLPVIRKNDIKVTAIHNHLAKETPSLKYMHIAATGKPGEIARRMKEVYNQTALPLNSVGSPADITVKWGNVEEIMGKEGSKKGELLKFGFPRQNPISMAGLELPSKFGVATAVNFQKIDSTDAVITGDFVMEANEVNTIMQTLTKHGITSTALHNHMLHEKPRLFYMHFWGKGNAEALAKGIRAALDKGDYE